MHTVPSGCEAWILATELFIKFCLLLFGIPKVEFSRRNLLIEFGIKLRFFDHFFLIITAVPPEILEKKSRFLLFPDFNLDFISMYLTIA